jgi:hypothetical protein
MAEFDYLAVGGGTAGCIVAARLPVPPKAPVNPVTTFATLITAAPTPWTAGSHRVMWPGTMVPVRTAVRERPVPDGMPGTTASYRPLITMLDGKPR